MLLLSIAPALHHWVFCGGSLPQALIRLDGCDISPWVGVRRVYVIDRYGPGLASVVLLGSRVVVVGEIVGCQANTGHDEGRVRTSASCLYRNEAVRGIVVEETQLEGGAERERNRATERTGQLRAIRSGERCCVGKSGEVAWIGVAAAAGKAGTFSL